MENAESEKLQLNEPLCTTDGTPCRVICSDFIRTLNNDRFNVVVAVQDGFGEEKLCLCTDTGITRNGFNDIINVKNQSREKPVITWDD